MRNTMWRTATRNMMWQTAVCALALIAGLSGCTKVSTSVGNGAGNAHSWTQPGVLRLSDISDPSTLNPMLTGADVAYQLASYMLEYLVQLDGNGNVIPVLCERIPTLENGDISKDGLTVRYHLRKNVTWSDGQPFGARDVVESWKQVMNPRNNVQIREGYD
ncbi:MAG: ABC transporter substrate-binding protein, partial [Candidatus Eremiobacteraeota bacterium]|nr:ABC transporter substrate-binding protein [Candidatus Eremiobacteraeota bacterium]